MSSKGRAQAGRSAGDTIRPSTGNSVRRTGATISDGVTPKEAAGLLWQALADSPALSGGIMAALAVGAFLVPSQYAILAVALGAAYLMRSPRPAQGPLGAEGEALDPDRNFIIGCASRDGTLVMASDKAMMGQSLVLGTLGTGKAENLLGIALSSLSRGSGLIYCEAKGHDSLYPKVRELARMFGREDDVLLLDLRNAKGSSNGFNALAGKTASEAEETLWAALIRSHNSPDARPKGRVDRMRHLLSALVAMEALDGDVEVESLAARFAWENVTSFVTVAEDGPSHPRRVIARYLQGLPGYNGERGAQQAPATMAAYADEVSELLSGLDEMIRTPSIRLARSDIDFADVISRRRILVVRLPDAGYHPERCGVMGRLVTDAILNGAARVEASRIGQHVDGSVPQLCILDDYESYMLDCMSEGIAACPNARLAVVYAPQDIPSFKGANEREAGAIVANTTLKMFMRADEVEQRCVLGGLDRLEQARTPYVPEMRNLMEIGQGDIIVMYGRRTIHAKARYFGGAPQDRVPKVSPDSGPVGLVSMPVRSIEGEKVR